jgi:hypothetical protein
MNSKKSKKFTETKYYYEEARKIKLGLPAYPDKLE